MDVLNNIKQADCSDLEEILSLQKVAFTEVAKLMGNFEIPPLLQTIQDVRSDFEQCIILKYISSSNQIIGSVRGNIYNGTDCYIGKLIVHPDFQNQGIGKALMYEIENYFPTCHKFTLFTGEETPNTLCLYKKVGYQVIYTKEVDGLNLIYMEKHL